MNNSFVILKLQLVDHNYAELYSRTYTTVYAPS